MEPAQLAAESKARWHELSVEQAAAQLGSDPATGLSADEIEKRLRQFGPNQVTAQKRLSEWMRFLLQFHQPLIYILLASTGIAAAMGEWVDAAVIFSVAFINAVVGYLQEAKAEKAIEALAKMVVTETTVRRTFLLVGAIVAFVGAGVGLVVGVTICWVQQTFHVVSMGMATSVVDWYPVKMQASDIAFVCIAIVLITLAVSIRPALNAGRLEIRDNL